MQGIKFGENYFIKCPGCGKTLEYNKTCECGYSVFKEQIKDTIERSNYDKLN